MHIPTRELIEGVEMPLLGFGTWNLVDKLGQQAVLDALQIGYRHIDTADIYGNHVQVGNAILQSGVPRDQIFLTSKVWYNNLEPNGVSAEIDRFLGELQTDYLDLVLIHWPNLKINMVETLMSLEAERKQGRIRSVGISNFPISLIKEMLPKLKQRDPDFKIQAHQFEIHPSLYQKELIQYCFENDIGVVAYSPLAQAEDMALQKVLEVAEKHGREPNQIILNWLISKGIAVIPRSGTYEHIKSNFDCLDIQLDKEDDEKLLSANVNYRQIDPPFAIFED